MFFGVIVDTLPVWTIGGFGKMMNICCGEILVFFCWGRHVVDEEPMGEEHSMLCESMSFTCEPEVPEESVCDGIMGDVGCVCEAGTVKTQTEMTRRVLAVQGESLYCPKDSCLMEKQGMESGLAGPMDQFYECYGIESGETSEGNLFHV